MSEKCIHNCTMLLFWMANKQKHHFPTQQPSLNCFLFMKMRSTANTMENYLLIATLCQYEQYEFVIALLLHVSWLFCSLCASITLVTTVKKKNTWIGTMTETKILARIIAGNVLCNWMCSIVRCTSIGIVQSQSNNNDSSDHKSIFASLLLFSR